MDLDILNTAFRDASLKVYRAKRHINEAARTLYWYVEQDFCKVIEEHNSWGGQSFFVETLPAPANLILSVGDAFHCLSSSFDYVMTGVMRAVGASTERVSFPSHEFRRSLEESFNPPKPTKKTPPNRRIGESLPAFQGFLTDKIQPYRGGRLGVWEIRKADNIDKHNLIIPSIALGTLNDIYLADDVRNVNLNITAHVPAGMRSKAIMLHQGGKLEVKRKGDPTLCVTFAKGTEVFSGAPILPTMVQSHQFAVEAIRLLADHFKVAPEALTFLGADDLE